MMEAVLSNADHPEYPDGSYTPYTWLLDCWTPAGMLSQNLTDSVRISGDLWEDWHIAPTN